MMNNSSNQNNLEKVQREIGDRITLLRESKGLTQTQLAKETSTKQSLISRYENGTTPIPIMQLLEFANFFNVSCDFLLKNESTDNCLNTLKKYIRLEYRNNSVDGHSQEYLVLHINKALVNYLYQAAQAEHISKLPDKAKEAWFKEMENEFNKSNKEGNFVSFIPFPIENISTDDSPNRWGQATLLENTTDFFTKNFS